MVEVALSILKVCTPLNRVACNQRRHGIDDSPYRCVDITEFGGPLNIQVALFSPDEGGCRVLPGMCGSQYPRFQNWSFDGIRYIKRDK